MTQATAVPFFRSIESPASDEDLAGSIGVGGLRPAIAASYGSPSMLTRDRVDGRRPLIDFARSRLARVLARRTGTCLPGGSACRWNQAPSNFHRQNGRRFPLLQ